MHNRRHECAPMYTVSMQYVICVQYTDHWMWFQTKPRWFSAEREKESKSENVYTLRYIIRERKRYAAMLGICAGSAASCKRFRIRRRSFLRSPRERERRRCFIHSINFFTTVRKGRRCVLYITTRSHQSAGRIRINPRFYFATERYS